MIKNLEEISNIVKETDKKDFYAKMCKLISQIFISRFEFKKILQKQIAKLKLRSRFFPNDQELIKTIDNLEKEIYNDANNTIRFILSQMSPEGAWMIENCYLNEETRDVNEWYLKHFSKTTFYKKKKAAILEFTSFYLALF
ncbi:hypothetical protein MCANUFG1_03240 [Mycoplasmopsis canis UFG1]|uniref:MG284/MPN403 family protein n=1 Tax=Mycoplasmopsis canis TaxID=29555 RepID=UPI00025B0B65|nr:hypothetical protein [Mycoplasmopsis canis]EIE41329.1 hypothetical protein MCANUFG1_03240 [Mycoplasmopsis canis UFG1]